jgi:hypothetical protein
MQQKKSLFDASPMLLDFSVPEHRAKETSIFCVLINYYYCCAGGTL